LARVIGRQEHLEQRERELVALNEISRVVTSTLTLDEVLAKLRHEIRDVIGAEASSIALMDTETGELVFRQADDPLADQVVGRRLQPKQGIAGLVAHTGRSILVPDTAADPRFYPGIDVETGLRTREIICAPLIVQDRTIGVIEIVNKRQGSFTSDDVRLLELVAAQTASTIENASLHEATQRELNERTKAERALRESKTRLQTFVDVTSDLIYLKDREGCYLLVNQAFLNHWQLEQANVIGQKDSDFMPPDRARVYEQTEQQVMDAQEAGIVEEHREGRIYEIRRTPVIDDQGQTSGLAGVVRDITERKKLQEQIVREQKEESILTLATGIVHDFNNALVGIVGNIDILRLDLPELPEVERTLQAMEQSAQRMVDLTNQLLAYAGGGRHRLYQIEPNLVVSESLEMLQIPESIALEQELAPDLWSIKADPSQIKQVLLSVLTNACEAMSDSGGTLSIRTKNVWADSWTCQGNRQHPGGEYVHIGITDTGPGMDDETKQHLFEPFFSTKFLGRGLGLPAAQGIIRDHRGCIEIESTVEQGTTVHIRLPRGETSSPHEESPDVAARRQGRVLTIEREPVVRSLIQRALAIQGYSVVLANDTDQALQIYGTRPDEFKIVILDLGMPGLEGKSLLSELRSLNPDIHVLLTSSYNSDIATKGVKTGKKTRFLQKPFSLEELGDSVESLLEDQGG
jgi:PAS domain S-box-containing protein